MPPTLSIGAFVLGAVLLLISVLRGGFKLFGAEVTGSAGYGGRVVAFVAGVVLIVTGFLTDRTRPATRVDSGSPELQPASSPPPLTRRTSAPELTPPLAATDKIESPITPDDARTEAAVVQVKWRAAVPELQNIVQDLSYEERVVIGLNAMLTGQDVYAIHIRFENIGNTTVTVSPERFSLTFGGEPIKLSTLDDERFLRRMQLRPNEYTEGIMTFQSAILFGGMILSQGRLSYLDPGVQVRYN